MAAHTDTGSSEHKSAILIIEDDPLLLESVAELLTLNGFRTAAATHGQNGLEMARSTQPDCILLDLRLPDIDGFAVLQLMKKDGSTAPIPIIVLSAFIRLEDQELALELGAAAYIVKPYTIDELVAAIRGVID